MAFLVGTWLGVEVRDPCHVPSEGRVEVCIAWTILKPQWILDALLRHTEFAQAGGLFALKTGQPFT